MKTEDIDFWMEVAFSEIIVGVLGAFAYVLGHGL